MPYATLLAMTDHVALAVFAISGALAAAERRLDILGFVLFGTITGIGGGTTRDLLLGAPVFWIEAPIHLYVCIGASVATWFLASQLESLSRGLRWADAVGLSLFCVLGAQKALALGATPVVAVIMGMMTASFGSLIRDSLIGRPPVLLEPNIYVTAAMVGALGYVAMDGLGIGAVAVPIAMAMAFALRSAAIIWDLRLPKYQR